MRPITTAPLSTRYLRRLVAFREPVVLSPYMPHSWWHPEGRRSMVKRLERKGFPPLWGWLFVTLTIDRELFSSEADAFKKGSDRVRRVVKALRDLGYPVKRYFFKFELQEDGWPHWHVGLDCREFIGNEEIADAWGLGFTKTVRVKKNRDFRYLFKYVVKDNGDIPDWVLDYSKRIRVFQTSVGFFGRVDEREVKPKSDRSDGELTHALRAKFAEWSTKGIVRTQETSYRARPVSLAATYPEIFIKCVESGARALDAYHVSLNTVSIVQYVLPWKPKIRLRPPQSPRQCPPALERYQTEAISLRGAPSQPAVENTSRTACPV